MLVDIDEKDLLKQQLEKSDARIKQLEAKLVENKKTIQRNEKRKNFLRDAVAESQRI